MKKIKKILSAALFFTLLILTLLYLFYHNKQDYTSVFFSHDTVVSIRASENITEKIKQKITYLSSITDNFDTSSDIYKLNEKKEAECSSDIRDMILDTEKLRTQYGNSVDIFAGNLSMLWHNSLAEKLIPSDHDIKNALKYTDQKNYIISGNKVKLLNNVSVDPGAIAKGYALDKIMPICTENTSGYAVVSFGSSTLLYSPDKNHTFNVAVKSDSDTIAGTVTTHPCFVSTSGDYERFTEISSVKYHHILDTRTGYPSQSGLSSVTVFCDSGIKSDFLSTLIFIEGKENLKRHLNADDYKIIAIDTEGNISKSSDLDFIPY